MKNSSHLTTVPVENHNRQPLVECPECLGSGQMHRVSKGDNETVVNKAALNGYKKGGYRVASLRCARCNGAGLVVKG